MKASEILAGQMPTIIRSIQANWGRHLGYVGVAPIALASDAIKVATNERVVEDPTGEGEPYTVYDGFWLENDTDLNYSECFEAVWKAIEDLAQVECDTIELLSMNGEFIDIWPRGELMPDDDFTWHTASSVSRTITNWKLRVKEIKKAIREEPLYFGSSKRQRSARVIWRCEVLSRKVIQKF